MPTVYLSRSTSPPPGPNPSPPPGPPPCSVQNLFTNPYKAIFVSLSESEIVCASRIPPTPSWLCGCVAPFSLSLYACETRCFMWSQGKTIVKAYKYERSMQGCENEAKMRSTASEILTNSVPHEQKATIWEPKLPKLRPKSVQKD